MDCLWAPWRGDYVSQEQSPGCFLCSKPNEEQDAANYVVARGKLVYVLLNVYPYTNGHCMVTTYRHIGEMEDLEPEEWKECSIFVPRLIRALKESHRPHGFNVGLNLGRVAGAGMPGHLHWHIVPRWQGDANFMHTLGETRVVPEALEVTYRRLKAAWDKVGDIRAEKPA